MKPSSRAGRDRVPLKFRAIILVIVATGLIAAAVATTVGALRSASELREQMDGRTKFVIANNRVMPQAQREVLRLRMMVALNQRGPARAQIAQVNSVAIEATNSQQEVALQDADLFALAFDARNAWVTDIRPVVQTWQRGDRSPELRGRALAKLDLLDAEYYNVLVTGAENNRKNLLSRYNDDTKKQLDRTQELIILVLLTFTAALLLAGVAFFSVRRYFAERQANSQRLRIANEELTRYAHILQATNSMVVVLDETGRIDWVNEAFTVGTGWPLDEVINRRPNEMLAGPESDPASMQRFGACIMEGRHFIGEFASYCRDGTVFWASFDVTPLHEPDGSLTGFVTVASDVSEQHAAQELLVRARHDAEATAREKAAFLATMSHEIRTPLHAVLGLTDLLRLTELDAEQRDYIETSHRSGKHLLSLLNDILDFSALESGGIEPEHRSFNLGRLVEDCADMMRVGAERKGLVLAVELDRHPPPELVGDEGRIRQVLVNLIGNAVKFTATGTVAISARIEERQPAGDHWLHLTVSDTGIGIDPGRATEVFRPFVQGDISTTRRFGGTGLGLAICQQIAAALGGHISLESRVDDGTRVDFVVPIELDHSPVSAASPNGEPYLPGQRLKVLVAEDDPVNQTVMTHMLRLLDMEARFASHGEEAVAQAAAERFDVILLDLQMPILDGVGAAKQITATAMGRPYLAAVTADTSVEARARLAASSFDQVLTKPVSLDGLREFFATLPEVVGQRD